MVVEDDDFTRVMIVNAISAAGYSVLYSSATPGDTLNFCKKTPVNVAVLDLHLGPGPTGIDLARALRTHSSETGIVLLTSYEDPRLMRANLPAPPPGTVFVQKKTISSINRLSEAIERAASEVQLAQLRAFRPPKASPINRLTDSQIDTLRYMARGLSNAEIAKRRFVTEKSVELSIARLARAVGVERHPSTNQRVLIARLYFNALGIPQIDTD